MDQLDTGSLWVGEGDAAVDGSCASSLLDSIDDRLGAIWVELQHSELWQFLKTNKVDRELVEFLGREWSLGISFSQPYFNEASRSALSKMPPTVESKVLRALRRLQAEVHDDGEAALRDYRSLGGDVDSVRTRQAGAAAYTVAAVWSMLGQEHEPYSYLGALYAVELTTYWVSERLCDQFSRWDLATGGLELPTFWETNAVRRSLVVRAIIQKVAMKYPCSWEGIIRGAEILIRVYPLPIFEEIWQRAARLYGGWSGLARLADPVG